MSKKTKKLKSIVDKYTQPVYCPNTLVVCKNVTIELLRKKYKDYSGNELEDFAEYDGCAYRNVIDKKENKLVTLVVLNMESMKHSIKTDNLYLIGVCSHEAFHAAYDILSYCGVDLTSSSNETYAYMVEWITKCIYKTAIK